MPAKRKRNTSYRKPYRRRKRASGRSMAGLFSDIAPRGPGSANYSKYGPSRRQMSDLGVGRSMAQSRARYGDRYTGDGGYFDDWSKVGRDIGHWGSRIVPAGAAALAASETGPMGMLAAGMGGWQAGEKFSKAQGWGNYNVGRGTNDLIQGSGNGSAPVYHSGGASDEMGDVIISNRELVSLIESSADGSFKADKFDLNPVDAVFHHLKLQASQYEQFEFLGLMFQYIPMTGEGGDNQLGVVGMCANYDPAATRKFTNIEEMMRYKGSTTCKPSVGMLFGVECDPNKRAIKTMYVRDHISRDKSFTDPATFYIGSSGIPTSGSKVVLGQLWVTYTVKLRNIKPAQVLQRNPALVSSGGINWTATADKFFDPSTTYAKSGIDLLTPFNYGNAANYKVQVKLGFDTDKSNIGQQWLFTLLINHVSPSSSNARAKLACDYNPIIVADCEFVKVSDDTSKGAVDFINSRELGFDTSTAHAVLITFKLKVTGLHPAFLLNRTNFSDSTIQPRCTLTYVQASEDVIPAGALLDEAGGVLDNMIIY